MSIFSLIVVFYLLTSTAQIWAGNQIYRYRDDSGTVTFTTELQSIPEKYRQEAVPLATVPPPPPQRRHEPTLRIVTSSGEFRMGNYDTRTDATRMAIEAAKRDALEQVATYLESVTEVKNLDVTRDEIRTYTAGLVMVLNQQTSTRLENGVAVIHVDLTVQADQQEVIQAITALRENENAKVQLASLRTETEQLRLQLDAANQALGTAMTAEQVQALTRERQQLLNQIQADALVARALTDYAYLTPMTVRQVNDLLLQARQLHPANQHLQAVEQALAAKTDPSALPLVVPSHRNQPSASSDSTVSQRSPLTAPMLESPLAATLPPSPLATPLPPSPLAVPLPPSPLAAPLPPSPLAKPLSPSPLAAPLAPSPLAAPLR
ncbi:MAG TPA: DUF4124 domain-containing protein [Nitrospira sp.]|nr:DUF4124 domain-containing protein [Nitrospira sp.]